MGYAGRDELLAALNELLEAERAGARVAVQTARGAPDRETERLAIAIERDEVHWCAVLARAIRSLEGEPSLKVGAFYEKAMAITAIPVRLAFLNRGQGWVLRKLRDLLPKVRDERLHGELTEMLRRHEANIALVNAALAERPARPEA
jgi:uncharacterized protein DUF6306